MNYHIMAKSVVFHYLINYMLLNDSSSSKAPLRLHNTHHNVIWHNSTLYNAIKAFCILTLRTMAFCIACQW